MTRRLVVEADGGSRGNPGPAAFGALVRDPETGAVLAESFETIGVATNNVAEYRGLIAGLRAAMDVDPTALFEVRLDSKLIVEQMSGRWRIKDPTLRGLAIQARDIAPAERVRYTWVPRAQNTAADALVNRALDGKPAVALPTVASRRTVPGWAPDLGDPTVLLCVRHGATEHSLQKVFSGSGGANPPLAPIGLDQSDAVAREIKARGGADRIVASPLLRAQQTAEVIASDLGIDDVDTVEGFAECDFGEWDGLTFAQVRAGWPGLLDSWLGSTAVAPPGGESFDAHRVRVERARAALVAAHPGMRVVLVAHVSPIKMLALGALGAPTSALFSSELMPCSLTTIAWWADGNCSMQGFAESGHLRDLVHAGM